VAGTAPAADTHSPASPGTTQRMPHLIVDIRHLPEDRPSAPPSPQPAYPLGPARSTRPRDTGPGHGYPAPFVRFDRRNPLRHPKTGERLTDEGLGDEQADWFIDTERARLAAKRVFKALSDFLAPRDIVLSDLCLFVTHDGETVFGEISQDCGRFRHFDLGSLDKDVWRAGGSSEQVLAKWRTLVDLITK